MSPTNKAGTHAAAAIGLVGAICFGAAMAPHAQTPSSGAAVAAPATAPPAAAGSGIWSGVYSEAQAVRGAGLANRSCVNCHGTDLVGADTAPTLVGLEFLSNWSSLPLSDLFDRILTSMPGDAPGSLSPQQSADLVAHILKLNRYPAGKTELSTDLSELKKVILEAPK